MFTHRMVLCFLVVFAGALLSPAQDRQAQRRPPPLSPRDSVRLTLLDTNVIAVNYGRPSRRGRTIMDSLVPYGRVWRTGANQATHLRTNFDMMLGSAPVTRGVYTLWTLPGKDRWTIIINKQTGQWGTAYDERQDLARFDADVERSQSPVDTFTIALTKTGPASGRLELAWEHTRVRVPFEKNDRIRPLSPPDSTETRIGGKRVKIMYSKPFMRGRQIWGVVVPFDSLWRTGANAPTTLTTEGAIEIGDVGLQPGRYNLRSIPQRDGLTLVISKAPARQGAPDSVIAGKVPMSMGTPSSTIDPFRIWITSTADNAAVLRLGWADREFAVEIKK